MKMSGEVKIEATRAVVWQALNSPEILQQTIPGCQELTQINATHLSARVKQKIGPISANFSGSVELSDLKELESYRISGEGSGGAAGFAKGGAFVSLSDSDDGGTILAYDVDVQVGGKMAQIGSRLIDSTAKKLADKFFKDFKTVVEDSSKIDLAAQQVAQDKAPQARPDTETGPEKGTPSQVGANWLIWIAGIGVAAGLVGWLVLGG